MAMKAHVHMLRLFTVGWICVGAIGSRQYWVHLFFANQRRVVFDIVIKQSEKRLVKAAVQQISVQGAVENYALLWYVSIVFFFAFWFAF